MFDMYLYYNLLVTNFFLTIFNSFVIFSSYNLRFAIITYLSLNLGNYTFRLKQNYHFFQTSFEFFVSINFERGAFNPVLNSSTLCYYMCVK